MKIRQLAVLLIVSAFSISAQAQVTSAMTPAQLKAEITRQLVANPNLDITALVNAAETAGVDMSSLAAAMVTVPGINVNAAVQAVVKAAPATQAAAIAAAAATASPTNAAAIAAAAATASPTNAAAIAGAVASAPNVPQSAAGNIAAQVAAAPNVPAAAVAGIEGAVVTAVPAQTANINAAIFATGLGGATVSGVLLFTPPLIVIVVAQTPTTCGGTGQSPC